MTVAPGTIARLEAISNVTILRDDPLALRTRFGIGGPATIYLETANEESFIEAIRAAREDGMEWVVIGSGSNLIVSDEGFPGLVLRYTADQLTILTEGVVTVDAGADLQVLVDLTIQAGLSGLHTMTGIPGTTGGAIYGDAGAYGHSISESIVDVRFFDGDTVRIIGNSDCKFQYRESIFKKRKDWIILSASLSLTPEPSEILRETAAGILKIRNEKYPPAMKCAGSIFKNLLLSDLAEPLKTRLPERVIREGKVPSAYFLEKVGAKGIRDGGIEVANYHANLIYNLGGGTAQEVRQVIDHLKCRVFERFGLMLEEEVQYVGF